MVEEIVRRAAATLTPTVGTARAVVLVRHAHPAPEPTPDAPPGRATAREPLDRSPSLPATDGPVRPGEAGATRGDTCTADTGAGLVLIDATHTPGTPVGIGDPTAYLAPGGVLAVLTTSDHLAGRLHDPRPALIAAAREAGLTYWQHIVTTRPDPEPDRTPGTAPDDVPDGGPGVGLGGVSDGRSGSGWVGRSWRLVADISVFRRPPRTTPADGSDADTTTEVGP